MFLLVPTRCISEDIQCSIKEEGIWKKEEERGEKTRKFEIMRWLYNRCLYFYFSFPVRLTSCIIRSCYCRYHHSPIHLFSHEQVNAFMHRSVCYSTHKYSYITRRKIIMCEFLREAMREREREKKQVYLSLFLLVDINHCQWPWRPI